jgi:hypothetical protein
MATTMIVLEALEALEASRIEWQNNLIAHI